MHIVAARVAVPFVYIFGTLVCTLGHRPCTICYKTYQLIMFSVRWRGAKTKIILRIAVMVGIQCVYGVFFYLNYSTF